MPSGEKSRIVFIACRVLEDLLTRLIPEGLVEQVIYMDYGLHDHPDKLKTTVQDAIESIQEPSLVVLGFGLCGDGMNGIKAGRHTLLIPRADDCIALLLGSYQAYKREFEAAPGTYYLSKGWLESDCHPLGEYQEYVEKYGAQNATFIMDMQYQHYERLVFVAHSQVDLDKYRPLAREVARYCERWGMRYQEILGSDEFIRRLIEAAARLDQVDEDFLIIAPGGEIRQAQFLRQV